MSGPIIRKYGYPNYDQIFGKKELQHGVDDAEAKKEAASADAGTARKDESQPAEKPKGA